MGNIDICARELLKDSDEFAKAFNMAFFNGRQVVRPENLTEADSVSFLANAAFDKDEKGLLRLRDTARNVIFREDGSLRYAVLGIENQAGIDYGMPLRLLHYDVILYMSKMRDAGDFHRKAGDWFSVTSEFSPTDRLRRVLSLVIYYGDKPWDGPMEITEMYGVIPEEIASDIEPYQPSYRMKVISAAMADDKLDMLGRKLRAVMYYARSGGSIAKLERILTEHPDLRKVPLASARLIASIMNVDLEIEGQKEMVNMENFIEQAKALGRTEGFEKGQTVGFEKGQAVGFEKGQKIIVCSMFNNGMELSEISKMTEIPEEKLEKMVASQSK